MSDWPLLSLPLNGQNSQRQLTAHEEDGLSLFVLGRKHALTACAVIQYSTTRINLSNNTDTWHVIRNKHYSTSLDFFLAVNFILNYINFTPRVFDPSVSLGVEHTRIIPEYLLFHIFLIQTKRVLFFSQDIQLEI